jgi:cation diffusion facilitator CzcD-associated flavoprotein CzcO
VAERERVVVIGAGPAGLASAGELKRADVDATVLERADSIGASWRGRYDRLRLNSNRWFSHLPGERWQRGTKMFPTRDQVVDHLEAYARRLALEIQLGVTAERVDREDGAYVVRTSEGELPAQHVIVATGYENRPHVPPWDGRDSFGGRLLHASEYRNPEPFRGQDVLVVGPGCSGMEIAYDLAEGGAGRVRLSVRTPPNIILRQQGGLPGDVIGVAMLGLPPRLADAPLRFLRPLSIGKLDQYGLPRPEEGIFTRLRRLGVAPAIVDKEVIQAVKDRRIEVVRGVQSLDETGVALGDGERIEPDAVIAATGYTTALEPLVGHLGVLDERGIPLVRGDEAAPGLRFVGFVSRPGAIAYMGREAKRAASAIARDDAQSTYANVASTT